MPRRGFVLLFVLFVWLMTTLAACVASSPRQRPTPVVGAATVTPTPTLPPAPLHTLRVWLPPVVARDENEVGYRLLTDRIQAFAQAHNLTAEIRIKPLDGAADLLTALNAARMVAPDAVPDVVLLPHTLLEAASVKGLAFPLPEEAFAIPLGDDDWLPYAQRLATVQSIAYGVPFGGDALGMLYHPQVLPHPPATWQNWLETQQAWLMPLGDPHAAVLLALYRAAGGQWQDEQGRPMLDKVALERLFTLLKQARENNLLSPDLLQIANDDMLWARYQGEGEALIFTRFVHLLRGPDPRRMAPIPAPEGKPPLLIADGLLWALTTPEANRQAVAAALLADLSQDDFLARWTEAAGYLPPRRTALTRWENANRQALATAILPAMQSPPPQEVITVAGPVLQKAAADVLTGAQSPASAAQWAVSTVENGG